MNASVILGAAVDLLIIGVIMAVILAIGGVAWWADRKRLHALSEGLTRAGMRSWATPSEQEKQNAFDRLGPFRDLREGAKGVVWCARGAVQGRDVTLVEHRYTTGSGKNRTTIRHTVAAVAAPEQWPAVSLVDENLLHKIADLFGSKDLRLEDDTFNKRWRISADHEEFALLVLSPQVQAWSLALERRAMIRVGRGGICIATNWVATLEGVQRLSAKVCELAALLPPELEAWGATTSVETPSE